MKTIIFAGLVAFAMTSMAQGTTAPATAPAVTATETKAPAKKAVKAKKAKKPKAAVAQPAPAVVAAPAATPAVTVAPAAGTSTAAPAAAAAPTKKWGAKLVIDATTNKDGVQDISNATVESVNYLGATYKLDAGTIGLRQYFTYDSEPGVDNAVKQDFTILTFGTKFPGILGSDEIAPLFWYYLPTDQATMKNFGTKLDGAPLDFYGALRADANINWTLSPKWSVGYYLNPRQGLAPTQDAILPDGKTFVTYEAATRLVHWVSGTYTISDAANAYAYAGFDNRMATERLTSVKDDQLLGVGMEFNMLGGKLIINPEISSTTGLKADGKTVEGQKASFFHPANTTYELVTVVSF